MKTSYNNFYNIAFLFLWCVASSSMDMVAANVFCPGQPSENFCDCGGDCTGNPAFCACDEAKACCAGATPVVLCPDQPNDNYCDCGGDCTEKPEWCQCEDAQECCDKTLSSSFVSMEPIFGVGLSGTILCPDQPKENYCDCGGDCTEKPKWCQCEDAQECCEGKTRRRVLLGTVLGVAGASFLSIYLYFCYSKKSTTHESRLSEAAVKVMSSPGVPSKFDDEVTVASADSHD